MKNATEVCNDPGYTGTVSRRFSMEEAMEVLSKLARLCENTAQSIHLKRSRCWSNVDSIIAVTVTVANKK